MRSTYIYVLDFYCVHVNTLLFAAYAFGFYLQSAFDLIRSVFDFVCSVIVFVMYVFLVCSVVTNGPPYDHKLTLNLEKTKCMLIGSNRKRESKVDLPVQF